MAESDGEIEYLDEDAEIVMHCVQQTQIPVPGVIKNSPLLLVERPLSSKKRKIEEDSDYDPTEEHILKKRQPLPKKIRTLTTIAAVKKRDLSESARDVYLKRKKLSIRIPDYDDPLCLPARAVKAQESDRKRLTNWNNVCLEHFKFCDELMKPEKGKTKNSVRTATFKNIVNKLTGSVETTIWSKTTVENTAGDKKSEIFQCVLPRYREKKVLNNYILGNRKGRSPGHKSEVVLCKEEHKDGEALVVYNSKESTSAIYGMVDKRPESSEAGAEAERRRYVRELACCKLCAACYQGSWRGHGSRGRDRTLVCPICGRTYISIYNLLSHFKTHSAAQMKTYNTVIGCLLSDVVSYHYKCRICRLKFDSIKALRQHTKTHQSNEVFMCEVGNHLVNVRK